jgi:hypothetical protein
MTPAQSSRDTLSTITFASCGLSLHPPHLLMVKSPGENVCDNENSNTARSMMGRNAALTQNTDIAMSDNP